jgi:hypothetical protein
MHYTLPSGPPRYKVPFNSWLSFYPLPEKYRIGAWRSPDPPASIRQNPVVSDAQT